MRVRFKLLDCPLWNRIIEACPDYLVEDFVEKHRGELFSDEPKSYRYDGIEFVTEADYTWFLLKI